MCVIIYKPAGIKLPCLDIIDKAHKKNPHGCGLCSPSVYYKGLSYATFKRYLATCKVEEPLLIHFRFATHGSIKTDNCHPFYDKTTGIYFMHNGILSNINPQNDQTDSECAFRKILLPFVVKNGLHSIAFSQYISRIIGFSKFAFMQDDEVKLFGDYVYMSGLYFSNLRFL